jgi:hypothetical protein
MVDQQHWVWWGKIDDERKSEPSSLREKIYQLKLWGYILKSNNTILNLWSRKMSINTKMLSKLMLYRITSNTDRLFFFFLTKKNKLSQQSSWLNGAEAVEELLRGAELTHRAEPIMEPSRRAEPIVEPSRGAEPTVEPSHRAKLNVEPSRPRSWAEPRTKPTVQQIDRADASRSVSKQIDAAEQIDPAISTNHLESMATKGMTEAQERMNSTGWEAATTSRF